MAVAALRNLVAKARITGAAALRASRAPAPRGTLPSLPPPKAELENALLVKNKIESAEAKDLLTSGDLIAQRCDLTEDVISQVSERHTQVSWAMGRLTIRYFGTGVILGFLKNEIESYYYNKAEFELEESRLAAEGK